jgi:hypothetical protein
MIMTAISEFTDNTAFYHIKKFYLVQLEGMAITFLWSGFKWLDNKHFCQFLNFHVVNCRVKFHLHHDHAPCP